MRKLTMMAVAVMGMSLGYPVAEAKEPQKETQAQPRQGPTDAEIDEAHRMNKEYDARKAAEKARAQSQGPTDAEIDEAHQMNKEYDARKAAEKARAQSQGPTDAEIDEAHRMNKEFDARKARAGIKTQEVQGKVQSVSGSALTIRMPSKLNRKMDFKTDEQSKVVKDSQAATLTELKEGDEVRVSYQIVGKERIVVSVDAQKEGSSPSEPAKKP
ncbi:hypothetical protein [Stigmatella erecta]|uniref:Uncharacterized protein n=1 Tax=Stigmatella erecta TaxID=83460 RepID=A0A1I0L0Q6_9BACT|nr:hypothetical protein [Stigmatella erecta]SEU31960.1 hypothetical protein SAMN05443639_116127 [Stigmatella erecta]